MTNDPSTNYFLARVTKPLENQDADLLRSVMLSLMAVRGCADVTVDQGVAQEFLLRHGYYDITGKRWTDAEFLARASLRGTTDREVAHLCVGIDYLFGKDGVLAPGLLQFQKTHATHYDPSNPYMELPDLPSP